MQKIIAVFALASFVLAFTYPTTAQQAEKMYRIGYLSGATAERDKTQLVAFREGLQELGYVVGKTIVIEHRFAEGRYKKLPEMAAQLIDLKVDVIVAAGPTPIFAKRATSTIPIVMRTADPVGIGLVTSLAYPGGNVTGMSTYNADLIGKRLELLKQVVPSASRVAVLHYPRRGSSHPRQLKDLQAAAPSLGITLLPVGLKGPDDFERVFSAIGKERPHALVVFAAAIFETHRRQIIEFAEKSLLPAIYSYDHWPRDGGLMSYGTNVSAILRRMAVYVDKILRGAKPANLPIELPTKFDLAVNLKTAEALGITFPRTILLRSTKVIE